MDCTGKLLVSYDKFGKPELKDSGIQVIKEIPNDYGIIVKTAIGPGRIGKSSLLNQLIRNGSFGIGSTSKRVTKGIWIDSKWNVSKKIATIYLDVEGFGDPDREDASDNRLIFIVSQVSDILIYNTKGVYDSDMIRKLQYVCDTFQKYRKLHQVFSEPVLIICFRDFDLEIPENPVEELKKYLRKSSDACFRCIKVFFLVKPTIRQNLRNMHEMSDNSLDQMYVKRRNELEKFLDEKARPLCTNKNKKITSSVLVEAMKKTIETVNSENWEGISMSLTDLLEKTNDKLRDDAEREFESQLDLKWPTDSLAEHLYGDLQRTLKAVLKEKLYDIKDSVGSILMWFEINTRNIFERLSEKKAKQRLESLNSAIESKYRGGAYFKIGGQAEFQNEMDTLEQTFKACRNLGPKANGVWKNYKLKQRDKEQKIKETEENLKQRQENERRLEQARISEERLALERERAIRERLAYQREQERLQRRRQEENIDLALNVGFELVRLGLTWMFSR